MKVITRFAPSPTGPLHLGHAYSAMLSHDRATASDGIFHLRIDDLDQGRARPEWEALIFEDLTWLGLSWPRPPMRQSERLPLYRDALARLWDMGLLYPCTCRRSDIQNAVDAPQEGVPRHGPDGIIYPGTCRPKRPPAGPMPQGAALRLDMVRALAEIEKPIAFIEKGQIITPDNMSETVGDVVLSRRELGASYHLSVVIDDADQQITHVIRGEDLLGATQIHVLLQRLLGLPTPVYEHHRLIRDENGKRLAKRDNARAIETYRNEGISREEIRLMLGL